LDTFGFNARNTFKCRDFCEAMVVRIPDVLDVAAPTAHAVGCVSDDCSEHVGISAQELAAEGLSTRSNNATRAQDDIATLPGNGTLPAELPLEERVQRLFRLVTNVVLGLFPAFGDKDVSPDDADSLIESHWGPQGVSPNFYEGMARGGVNFQLGPRTLPSRHGLYKQYAVKAAAWVAAAVRRLRASKSYVRKWFRVSESQTSAQTDEVRRHLMRILKLMQKAFIKKGLSNSCSVSASGGTLAFVMASANCNVQSKRDCGEKTDSGRYIINICEFYWDSYFDTSVRVGTIVHESSHHFGTDDRGYCDDVDCLSMSSDDARNNADSYANFVQDLVSARDLVEEAQWDPDWECNTGCGAQKSTFGNIMQEEEWTFRRPFAAGECGDCTLRTRGLLFGEDCRWDESEMATGWLNRVCCVKFDCEKPEKPSTKSNSTSDAMRLFSQQFQTRWLKW
jgi:hypothetical protein